MAKEELLHIDEVTEKGVGVVRLGGQLLAESRFPLDRLLRDWHEGGVHQVVISCADLRHIDSAGLSTMIGALHRMRREGGTLLLCNLNPTLHTLFEVSSMESYFEIFADVDEAKKQLRKLAAAKRRKANLKPAENKAKVKSKAKVKAKAKG